MTVQNILEAAQKYTNDYEIIGIRTQEEPFELGRINHTSHIWDNGDDTGDTLDGISATIINSQAIIMHSDEHTYFSGFYFGNHKAIIGGNRFEYGEDDGELIIKDPVVVGILA